MRKFDPVKSEIAKADFLYSVAAMTQAARTLIHAVERLSYQLAEVSLEASLLEKDNPFDEDGQPNSAAMYIHAECDQAVEMLNELRIAGKMVSRRETP